MQEYNPIGCEHRLPNGLSAWLFQSEQQSNANGGPNKVSIHVCSLCGEINIGGYRTSEDGEKVNDFHETFNLYHSSAIDPIIKAANFFNEEIKWGRINEAPSAGVWVKASDVIEKLHFRRECGRIIRNGIVDIYIQVFWDDIRKVWIKDAEKVIEKPEFLEILDENASPGNKEREQAIGILKTLCDLKQYKDAKGKDEFYEQQKELAWKEAFDFLKENKL